LIKQRVVINARQFFNFSGLKKELDGYFSGLRRRISRGSACGWFGHGFKPAAIAYSVPSRNFEQPQDWQFQQRGRP